MEEKGGDGFSPPKKEGKKKEIGGEKEREGRNGEMEIKPRTFGPWSVER